MKARAATARERDRAYRLRRRSGDLSKRDRAWLDAYTSKRKKFKAKRSHRKPSRPLTAREEAVKIVQWAAEYVSPGEDFDIETDWTRPSRRGKPGIARATSFYLDAPVAIYDSVPTPLPIANHTGRLANIRALVRTMIGDMWVPLIALTSRWGNIPGDLRAELHSEYFERYMRSEDEEDDERGTGILALNVQVSNERAAKHKPISEGGKAGGKVYGTTAHRRPSPRRR